MRIEIVYFASLVLSAFGSDAPCLNTGGTCQYDHLSCPGGYVSGLCSGASNRRCCQGDDSACLDEGGTCQDDSLSCSGEYVSGLCSGASNRRCCIEDSACRARDGTCQDDSLSCPGEYLSGLCSGASNRRCCIGADSGMCSNVKVYSRATWGARDPTSVSAISTPVDLFFIHHTTGSRCYDFSTCAAKVRNTQNYHMNTKGWSDIGYSFLVGEDGAVYEGRGWNNVGAHTSGYNSQSFAAAVMGNFMTTKPNTAALNAVKNLIQCGVNLGHITSTYRLYGHRDVSTSSCPGDALYNEIKTWPDYSTVAP
eukprot:XP_011448071.1 PREDICTED: peptidoglycan-recognition protein SC2-like isoform X3 [Crassostrea gigas]